MRETKKPSFLEEIPSDDPYDKVLLCSHGLNQNPEALKTLLKDLSRRKMKTYLLHLPGHGGESDFTGLTGADFFTTHQEAYLYLQKSYDLPLYFLGYSFGALIGVHQFPQCPFKKMVLLAPAIRLRRHAFLLKPILPFVSRIPSVRVGDDDFERRYRYHHAGVPTPVYSSFFSIYKENKQQAAQPWEAANTLMMMHPRDELVSFTQLKKLAETQERCTLIALDNSKATARRYNHLCFDPMTLGGESYQKMVKDITRFL